MHSLISITVFPLAGSTSSFLLGFQVSYITEEYNIMYGFGGFRLMKFNYSDADWESFRQ